LSIPLGDDSIMLKQSFYWKKQTKTLDDFFLAELDGYLLDSEHFLTRMRHERLRSERYQTPLSLIIINIVSLVNLASRTTGWSPRKSIRCLTDLLKNSTRESDIKGWYQERRVALLAPNTDKSGSQAMVRNLTKIIASHIDPDSGIPEEELAQYITISSVQPGCSYLSKDRQENREEAETSLFEHFDTIQFASPLSSNPSDSPNAGTVDVTVAEWPFSIEIQTHEQLRKLQIRVKRVIDIVGSLIGLVLTAPLITIIAALIKLTSCGPIFFRQERLGFLGKPFTLLKFRSMKVECDSSLHHKFVAELINDQNKPICKSTAERSIYKLTNDPRVTPLGKILRKTSLDELPQLLNVLRGDMSLVGPRPHPLYECEMYKSWYHRRLLQVKPGITGLWQVVGRSTTTYDEMIRMDIDYQRKWNLWLDLKIILKTFRVLISTKGGY
jgi:lipopolysaccharide/colanic/teichoic acid biosynthesis glycosyltransferase